MFSSVLFGKYFQTPVIEMLMSYGKEIYLVEMEGKDANEIGFENFLNTIEQTQPLNFQSLLEKKLQLL